MDVYLRILGILILGLVACQLAVYAAGQLSRWLAARRLHQLRIEQLRLEIEGLRQSLQTIREAGHAWEGWRKFRVHRKVLECRSCHSLYLVPHDGKPLPHWRPGQYLTLQLRVPDEPKPLVRCYSLSSAPHPEYFRCTIKQATAAGVPPGRASSFLNDRIQVGDLIDVKSPRGRFTLDEPQVRPLVLLAAGIGVTPLLSMLDALTQRPTSPEVFLFYGVRNSQEHAFREELNSMQGKAAQVHVMTSYSQPLSTDGEGTDYDISGRLNINTLKQRLPSNNFQFLLCGPAAFMETFTAELKAWGVPEGSIHTERFSPPRVRPAASPTVDRVEDPSALPAVHANPQTKVMFERSQQECEWDATANSLLELAESVGVVIDAGCRNGNCGTCITAIKSGAVDYSEPPESACEEGSCLPCVARPKGPLVLDA
ncbi:MAG: 2Fe-2S iron-sulfur cluster-binding protein [Planctomycetota bacterium]